MEETPSCQSIRSPVVVEVEPKGSTLTWRPPTEDGTPAPAKPRKSSKSKDRESKKRDG